MHRDKQCVATSEILDMARMARTLLVLSNYDWLSAEAKVLGVTITPLKGVDLLRSLYADTLDRDVSDIDILCHNTEEACRLAIHLCQEDYRLKDPYALRPDRLVSSKKIALVSCSMNRIDIDIHLQPVTKKFYAHTVDRFNREAITRADSTGLHKYDRWLFLAQHAAFHNFCKQKWTRDLDLLFQGFSPEQIRQLHDWAKEYGFTRMEIAAIFKTSGLDKLKHTLTLDRRQRNFLKYLQRNSHAFSRSVMDRIKASYWEFIFIDKSSDRFKEWCRLMLPSPTILSNIYKIKNKSSYLLFYPLNVLISGLTSTIFAIDYLLTVNFNKLKDD